MKLRSKILPIVLAIVISQSCVGASVTSTSIEPHKAPYGYFVDTWKNNSKDNMKPETNPSIGTLSGYLQLWNPGSAWDNGKMVNSKVLNDNIKKVITITSNRTKDQEHQAYLDDRRNQNYSVTDGLGLYTDAFRNGAGCITTIPDVIPADSTTVKYEDKGDSQGNWAETNTSLGSMVNLVNIMRNSAASTTPAKNYYQYPRPWRWSKEVKVLPTLVPEENPDPKEDGGFPSGHTNAATISAIGLAYAVPERYQEMITRASELGNNRIVAGMHSPLDVMGGRVMATAISASALNNPDNQSAKVAAYNDAHTKLLTQNCNSVDRFSKYAENKKNYIERLTYGFEQTCDKNKPMVVPKGAEVLLETRLPYLDAAQRRWVLYTTGLPSGYPVLDDAEGWGRLNLFAAADGYGAFLDDVTVTMDASKGGFNAADKWRNDISGNGKLTKKGTGALKLGGNNTYNGGTEIVEGSLEADSNTAFGNGKVVNNGGTLIKNVSGVLNIGSDFKQSSKGTLELNIGSKDDETKIKGEASFGGILKLNFTNGYVPVDGMTIINCGINKGDTKFSSVIVNELPSSYKVSVVYKDNNVQLQVKKQ